MGCPLEECCDECWDMAQEIVPSDGYSERFDMRLCSSCLADYEKDAAQCPDDWPIPAARLALTPAPKDSPQ